MTRQERPRHNNRQFDTANRISDSIRRNFPPSRYHTEAWYEKITKICTRFVESGRADREFESELISGDCQKFWARVSEALIADILRDKEWVPRDKIGLGPDFLIKDGETNVWVEVICPEPTRISAFWLNDVFNKLYDLPAKEILLRWTSATQTKAERLFDRTEATQQKGYRETGVVDPNDVYVIAVNGCRLRNGDYPALDLDDEFPFAAQAVFAIGERQVRLNKDTKKVIDSGLGFCPSVKNHNNADVSTDMFMNPRYKPISAIWAVDLRGYAMNNNPEPKYVVYNPNAANPLTPGFLPSDRDYVSEPAAGDEGRFVLHL